MELTHILLESLPEPHLILSRSFSCLAVNKAFAQLVRLEISDIVGASATSFWPSVRTCAAGGEVTVELRASDGRLITARVESVASEAIVVRVLASVASGEAAQLHHKQRLETLGLLSGGIAHDFNNVLTGILGHVAYMKHVLADSAAAGDSIKAIEEGALRASGLTQQILKFSKLDSTETSSPVDVPDLITRVVALLRSAIPTDITLCVSPTSGNLRVLASESHITQILINLIINARDAISGKGAINVAVEGRCSDDEVARLFGAEPIASAYGAIVVQDDGIGMDEQVKARLFERYFTTKSSSGTGLGLATVNSIVQQLGGAIEVVSEPKQGSVFRIVLPAVTDEVVSSSEAVAERGGVQKGKGERVLVIDDEYAVRNVLGLSLSHLGYQVETADGGFEGVEKFEQSPEGFSLVILDLLMPGLSGEEVFNRLRARNPELPVLIVSGFSSEHVVKRVLEDGARDFIQKPFSIEVLSEKVRGCLRD